MPSESKRLIVTMRQVIKSIMFSERIAIQKASPNISQWRRVRDRSPGNNAAGSDAPPAHNSVALGIFGRASATLAPQSHVYPRQSDNQEPLSAIHGLVWAFLSFPTGSQSPSDDPQLPSRSAQFPSQHSQLPSQPAQFASQHP